MADNQNAQPEHQLHLGWKLKDLNHLHHGVMQNALSKIGLHSGQPRILFTIDHLEGASQKEIAAHLRVSPASLATSLKRMQKAGFLARSSDKHDLRVNKIELTAQGRQAIAACKKQIHIIDQTLKGCFSQQELDQLISYLDRIYSALQTLNTTMENAPLQIHSDASEVNT